MGASATILAGYAEGCLYPPDDSAVAAVQSNISTIQSSGLNTVILSLFHIGRNYHIDENTGQIVYDDSQVLGDIYCNGTLVFSQGAYVGYNGNSSSGLPSWPDLMNGLTSGGISNVTLSVGGGYDPIHPNSGVLDFTTIAQIYDPNSGNPDQASGQSNLEANFRLLKSMLTSVSCIDMDCEDKYDETSFVAFCNMLIGVGFGITFCPYMNPGFWTDVQFSIESANPGSVKWWNLQCYDGGGNNADPTYFAETWPTATPDYIALGDWTSDSPSGMQTMLSGFQAMSCICGAFLWTIDDAITAGNLSQYASAMKAGLTAAG